MAFSINNYALKYYAEFTSQRNDNVRLEIYEKMPAGTTLDSSYPREIGEFRSLQLEVDGRSESIEEPIVKTTLIFSMVDTSDYGDEVVTDSNGTHIRKHGNWQEFYTPDATKFYVAVKSGAAPGTAITETRWGGYITPDSWRESLEYHGTISITARDGIGSLDEIPFNLTFPGLGRTVQDIILGAWNKADIPMPLVLGPNSGEYSARLRAETLSSLLSVRILGKSIDEQDKPTWFELLEDILESLGLVIRYTDPGEFTLVPLRHIPYIGTGDASGALSGKEREIQFHGGNRLLDPAFKTITEKVDFDYEDPLDFSNNTPTFDSSTRPTYNCVYYGPAMIQVYAQLHRSNSQYDEGAWEAYHDNPCFLNASLYPVAEETLEAEGDGAKNYLFVSANRYDNTNVGPVYRKELRTAACKFTLRFAPTAATVFNYAERNDWAGTEGEILAVPSRVGSITYKVQYQSSLAEELSQTIRYWNGSSWVSEEAAAQSRSWSSGNPESLEVEFPECPDVGSGYLVFRILNVYFILTDTESVFETCWRGLFFRIEGVAFEARSKRKVDSHTTTTNNELNTACNVLMKREPKYGFLPFLPEMLMPDNYKRAFFMLDSSAKLVPAPFKWRWGSSGTYEPFPAIVAKQLLCYHAASEPVLEGEFSPVEDNVKAAFNYMFKYKGVNHIFQGGTLDFVKGRFSDATLRGFLLYDDILNS